jgi:glycosyltransferase involved in cell wall biosynthesis
MILLADARPLADNRPLPDAASGGVRRVTLGLLRAMQATRGAHSLIYGVTGHKLSPLPADLIPHTHTQRIPNKVVNLGAAFGIRSFAGWFKKEHADAVLLPNFAIIGPTDIPYAMLVHDLSFFIEPAWYGRKSRLWYRLMQSRKLLREASHLFAVSERTKADLINLVGVDPSRVTVIPLGIEPLADQITNNEYRQASGSSLVTRYSLLATRYLLALGLGNPRKNADCAIQAWRIARKTSPELKLVLIGPGELAPEPGIEVRPSPTDAELSNLMRHASAFLYPSWYEGFGLPLHEAAFFNTPCIASTAGSLPETAPAGTLFAPPHKPHLWAEAVQTILKNPTNYQTQTQTRTWDEAANIIWKKLNA